MLTIVSSERVFRLVLSSKQLRNRLARSFILFLAVRTGSPLNPTSAIAVLGQENINNRCNTLPFSYDLIFAFNLSMFCILCVWRRSIRNRVRILLSTAPHQGTLRSQIDNRFAPAIRREQAAFDAAACSFCVFGRYQVRGGGDVQVSAAASMLSAHICSRLMSLPDSMRSKPEEKATTLPTDQAAPCSCIMCSLSPSLSQVTSLLVVCLTRDSAATQSN